MAFNNGLIDYPSFFSYHGKGIFGAYAQISLRIYSVIRVLFVHLYSLDIEEYTSKESMIRMCGSAVLAVV